MQPKRKAFTIRAFLIGAFLCFCIGIGEVYGVMRLWGSPLANDHSAGLAIFLLFFLVIIVNTFLKALSHNKIALQPGELALVYLMMIIACAIPSWGLVMNWLFLISGVHYFASATNRWDKLIHPYVPKWLTIQDKEAIKGFFEGLPKGLPIPYMVWLKPILLWLIPVLALFFAMVSLAVIFRKQWMENEKLQYPLMQVPLAMVVEEAGQQEGRLLSSFFVNKLMWLGFLVPFSFNSLVGLHRFYPQVPYVNPWMGFACLGGAYWVRVFIKFEIIGIAFLLSKDISLSIWLFSLLYMIEDIIFIKIGFSIGPVDLYSGPAPPPIASQMLGAFFVFVFSSLWFARGHLKAVFGRAFFKKDGIDDSVELLSYRTCIIGIIVSVVVLILWLIFTGFSVAAAFIFTISAFFIFIGLSLIICQAGVVYARAPVCPGVFTLHSLGTSNIGPGGSIASAFTFPYSGDIRAMVMAACSQGLKVTEGVGVKGRRVIVAVMVAIIVSLLASIWWVLLTSYKYGGVNCGGWQPKWMSICTFDWAAHFVTNPATVDWRRFAFFGIGAVLMFLNILARTRFVGFPIHPVGMTITYNVPTIWVWFSFFLGWLFKSLILKYGGYRGYRSAVPLFSGMIIGAFTSAAVWNIVLFFTKESGLNLTLG